MQSLKILPPWPGCDPLTSHNLWLLNLEPCTLHSSPPAPQTPAHYLVVEKTTSASYRGSGQARAPLECPMQEAIVTCTRAAHLMAIIEGVPNSAALVQVTIASCIGYCGLLAKGIPLMHVNYITDPNSDSHLFTLRAHVVLTLCYLCWWSFLPPTSAYTLLAHVVLHSVTCTGGLFLSPTTTFTLLPSREMLAMSASRDLCRSSNF